MAGSRLTIDTISGRDLLFFLVLPRRWFVSWRIKGSPLLRNALAAGDVEVTLPNGERWRIAHSGSVERTV